MEEVVEELQIPCEHVVARMASTDTVKPKRPVRKV